MVAEPARGDLPPEHLQDVAPREVLDGPSRRREGDEVDIADLKQLPEDQLAAAVAVDEDGRRPLGRQVGDRRGHVGALDGDGVFDAVLQQLPHVGASLDDDDRIGALDARARRQPRVLDEVLDANRLPHVGDQLLRRDDRLVERRRQQLLRAVDDRPALGRPNVLDLGDLDVGPAGPDALDGLQ